MRPVLQLTLLRTASLLCPVLLYVFWVKFWKYKYPINFTLKAFQRATEIWNYGLNARKMSETIQRNEKLILDSGLLLYCLKY